MAREISVAIVGLGSRGLSVLERVVTLAKRAGSAAGRVRVEVIDPTCVGAGVHDPGQPDYLLLNTTCSQVSMFPDAATVGSDVDQPGPNLYQWVIQRGLRIGEDGFTVSQEGRQIRPVDFLPRRLLGEYLEWFRNEVRRRAPEHVRVTLHPAAAVDFASESDHSISIALSDGTRVHAQYAFLTTGYTPNRIDAGGADDAVSAERRRLIAQPYPLPEQVARVEPGQAVAVDGFGLCAIDLMSCLTVGRGGRFSESGGQLRYLPSGQEPMLLMFSRSGVPCRARPLVVEFGPRYEPLVFTEDGIDAQRVRRGGPLDFDEDLLPLILTELRIAYRRREARCAGGDLEAALIRDLTSAATLAEITVLLDDLDTRGERFDAAATFDGSTDMLLDDSHAYQKWLAEVVRRDLAEGALGFERSPVKAAIDILRDQRDTFRYAVDYGGLTDSSLDEFTRRTVPLVNRAVVGPQFERHSELLALMDAGIVEVPFGPAPSVSWNHQIGRWTVASSQLRVPQSRDADWLVSAHVSPPAVESSASPFITALHRGGWIRRHRPASRYVLGVDVDPNQHPIGADGIERRLWVLGPLCEGATFYNNLVPSPNTRSRPLFDAHRCVAAMFAAARASQGPA
jgi:uncharacterized NAD(P)/FAD-binding protein YdhS